MNSRNFLKLLLKALISEFTVEAFSASSFATVSSVFTENDADFRKKRGKAENEEVFS